MNKLEKENYLIELNNQQLKYQDFFKSKIFYYQELARRVWKSLKDLKWMLLEYGPGVGKTRASILMTLSLLKQIILGLNYNIIYVGQVSLERTLQYEYKQLGIDIENIKNIKFYTYQKLVNQLFTSQISTKKNFESYDDLLKKLENKSLEINLNILDELKNSVIIIDEFQKLYRTNNINTYGYTLKYLIENNVVNKLIILSGTILNSTINELEYILFILGEIKTLSPDKYFTKNKNIIKLKEEYEKIFLRIFLQHSLCYRFNENTKEADNIFNGEKLYNESKIKIIKCEMSIPQTKYIIEKYNEYMNELDNEDYLDEEENISGSNKFLSKKYYYTEEDIPKNKILKGKDIDISELKLRAPVAFKFISFLFDNLKKKDFHKCVAYDILINNNFGTNQYKEILLHLGFHLYGTPIVSSNICMICGKKYEEHNAVDKITKTHQFQAITFSILDGSVPETIRYNIREVFNSSENILGKNIYLLILSEVGETSITLKAVNYFYILSYIPSFSRLEQLLARTNRAGTHRELPDRRWVEINILLPTFNKKISDKKSPDEEYFISLEKNNKEIENFLSKLRNENIINNIPYGKYIKEQFNPFLNEDLKILRSFLVEYFKNVDKIKFTTIYKIIHENLYNFKEINFKLITKYQLLIVLINNFSLDNYDKIDNIYSFTDKDFDKLVIYNTDFKNLKDIESGYIQVSAERMKIKDKQIVDIYDEKYKDLLNRLNDKLVKTNINKFLKEISDYERFVKDIFNSTEFLKHFAWSNYLVYMEGDDDINKYIENHISLFADLPPTISFQDFLNNEKSNEIINKIDGIIIKDIIYMRDGQRRSLFHVSVISRELDYRGIIQKTSELPSFLIYKARKHANETYSDSRKDARGCNCLTLTDEDIKETINNNYELFKSVYPDIENEKKIGEISKLYNCRLLYYLFLKINMISIF